jgi:FkbM family methyltransferase
MSVADENKVRKRLRAAYAVLLRVPLVGQGFRIPLLWRAMKGPPRAQSEALNLTTAEVEALRSDLNAMNELTSERVAAKGDSVSQKNELAVCRSVDRAACIAGETEVELSSCGALVPISLLDLPGFAMTVHRERDAFISHEIARNGNWEPFETRIVRELLRHVDFFVDAGANIGWYSIVAALALKGRGLVIAFEPDSANFSLLERNTAQNSLANVRLVNAALADSPGKRLLFRSPDNLGDHRLYGKGSEGRATVSVQVTTFDSAAASLIAGPCVVKMDTQGSEAMILAGMRQHMAARSREVAFLMEFWPFGLANAGSSAEALLESLRPLSLRAWVVEEVASRLVPTSLAELAARAYSDLRPETQAFANLLMIPAGHPVEAALQALDQRDQAPPPEQT